MRYRKERLESLISQLISQEIIRVVEVPGTLITVIKVIIDDKLETAKIYVEIFPDSKRKDVKKILKEKIPYFYRSLKKKIKIFRLPNIVFK